MQSEFKRIFESANDLTKSDAFKRWFGLSKVVNGDGDPLMVYHGTSFRPVKRTGDKLGGHTWYTDDPEFANTFLGGRRKHSSSKPITPLRGRIYPVFLKIELPVECPNGSEKLTPREFAKAIDVPFDGLNAKALKFAEESMEPREGWEVSTFGAGMISSEYKSYGDMPKDFALYLDNDNLLRALQEYGFDGVITSEEGHRTFQVWDESQVKSIWEKAE